VFIKGGLVAFVTSYHKGYDFAKKVKVIHRYVPWEVSELVVYFLGLGRPFVDDLQMMHHEMDKFTTFIWEPPADYEDDDSEDEDNDVDDGDDGDEERGDGEAEQQRQMPANPDGY
jgi:hypothetical protein